MFGFILLLRHSDSLISLFNVLAVAGAAGEERNEAQLDKNNFEEAAGSDETAIEANERPVEVK